MRTTLSIDDDVLSAAKKIAAAQEKTVGEVISSLARRALNPIESRRKTRNGVPLLPVRPGTPKGYLRTGESASRGTWLKRFLIDINVLIALIERSTRASSDSLIGPIHRG